MIFKETPLKGAFLVELEKIRDERGFFARTWCRRAFEEQGLNARLVQCNASFNKKKGTLRGMHLQAEPYAEDKLIRCTQGAIYDVIIDLRPKSQTFKGYFAQTLTEDNGKMLYAPKGFAHGFLTLQDDTEVFYQMSEFYAPEAARGVRWNDPAFAIEWPEKVRAIAPRDQNYPDFNPAMND